MMLKSAFTFSDKVAECYIQMTVIRLAKIGVQGRPNEADLKEVFEKVVGILRV